MKKIKKALIPAAGLGTRFLPATKTVPKELLPIVDRPILLFIVEEAVRAGIEDIVIVAGRNKTAIEDFFDCSYELEDTLRKKGQIELLQRIEGLKDMANIISIRQKQALGLGHAVLTGQPVIGNEPFAVLLGDEIMVSEPDKPTVTEQLSALFFEHQKSTVAVMKVDEDQVNKYGIIKGSPLRQGLHRVESVVEKPHPDQSPSQLALPGRYVFTAEIFSAIKECSPGVGGEIQLTDGMTKVAQSTGLLAYEFQATRYDAGDRLGYLQANIEMALRHPELGEKVAQYLRDIHTKINYT